jgi:FMN phosphatase YigB (HAD superfamily)
MKIICDLDGTLCDHTHRKHLSHIDFEGYNGSLHLDTPRKAIVEILRLMGGSGAYDITLLTGRPEQYRGDTRKWLEVHDIYWNHLLMRPTGDMRSDTALKAELLLGHCKLDDILFILEDRDCVVDMWRTMGLTCLQVERFEVNHGSC